MMAWHRPTGDQVLTGAGQVPVGEEHLKDGTLQQRS